MVIYPFSPEELDDKTLKNQIKTIAQVLCQIHYQWIYYHEEIVHPAQLLLKKIPIDKLDYDIKIFEKRRNEYADWGYECRANYLELVKMGIDCCYEYMQRHSLIPPYDPSFSIISCRRVIKWAADNVPGLPLSWDDDGKNNEDCSPFPVVMPDIHKVNMDNSCAIQEWDVRYSYRSYYEENITKKSKTHEIKWTRRKKPEWLNL